ncbi:MAG: DNA repair protein RecN [Spirochaetaceae bacterium 4572_7]|nr:MAG: DNA repair protein RecN [Spirochaetaceae bacterium 4572_7]
MLLELNLDGQEALVLEELSVTNYALIDDVTVSFSSGLNILTGETGAGKSLLVGALGLIFGKKGSPSFVRNGCDEATVSALVDLSSNLEAKQWLTDAGIIYEDDQVLIKRNIRDSGRGSQYIQGYGVIRSQLEEFSALLFDMHGQHEHQSLFSKVNHRKLLDKYSHLTEDVVSLFNQFQNLNKLKEKLLNLETLEDTLEDRTIGLKKIIEEILEVKLVEGEEESLDRELKLLRNMDSISILLNESIAELSGNKGIISKLKNISLGVDKLGSFDDEFLPLYKRVTDSFFEIEDISETLEEYKRNIDYSPEVLQIKENRLTDIFNIQKKYGPNLSDVNDYLKKSEDELDQIASSGKKIDELKELIDTEQKEILIKAKALSDNRKSNALIMQKEVENLLKELSLPNVNFVVEIVSRKDNNGNSSCGPWGMDDIEFLMSMNPGEPLKPVKQIASGGEISRIMLALKSVLADVDSVGCLIFDEIDSGIGGEVALSIGNHLKKLSKNKQVLSITHLASIASCGENHLKVIKSNDGLKTKTDVIKLDEEERVGEIARMLSGDCSEASMNHARELLGTC